MPPSHPSRGRGGECPSVPHGHGRLLLVDLDLFHLLLDLLQLHLLLPVLGQLLHLSHPHGRLLLLAVVIGIDGVTLCRVGPVLLLGGGVEGHDRVLDIPVRLFGY